MTNEAVREKIINLIGKKVLVKVNIGRNKSEYFEGIIIKTYPFLFIMQVGNEIKSFSYADILTKSVILKIN